MCHHLCGRKLYACTTVHTVCNAGIALYIITLSVMHHSKVDTRVVGSSVHVPSSVRVNWIAIPITKQCGVCSDSMHAYALTHKHTHAYMWKTLHAQPYRWQQTNKYVGAACFRDSPYISTHSANVSGTHVCTCSCKGISCMCVYVGMCVNVCMYVCMQVCAREWHSHIPCIWLPLIFTLGTERVACIPLCGRRTCTAY